MLAAPSVPKPLATDINKMATLENYNGIPEIQSFSESFSPSNIKLRYALNTSSHVSVIQFSSSGSKIAFADGYFLYIINSEDGEIYATLQLPTPITGNAYTYCLKFSQDDNLLAVSGPNNSIILFDVEKRTIIHTFEGHTKEVNTLIFNGNQLISSSFDSSIIVWDVKTYEVIKRLPESNNQFDSPITGMAAASGVPFFVVGFANGRIGIYDDEFVQPMISFTGHEKDVVSVAVSQFDDCIGTSSTKEPSIKIWVVRGVASLKQTLKGHSDYIQTITFSPKEPLVFTGSADKTIRLWKYKTGEQIGGIKMHNEEVCCISHHPNNKVFVSCSKDGVVCVWDYESPK
ncbi:Transcriptional repressor tup12-related protein [Histomonas meleagridis]|uniref:Transcriptional repressor tup12-related protein n=1 Tax=Histomonas meleagridis TaxID=135588 RepID=UPI00355A09A7|nr:Transcriptional repressor tup12-related protein [Histomonas meleagridis]KAH0804726.1 Transcriptional repressor tup12-related protein [Histomonas meleagridis]